MKETRLAGFGPLLGVVVALAGACSTPTEPVARPAPPSISGQGSTATPFGVVAVSEQGCTLTGASTPLPSGPMTLSATNRTDHQAGFHLWRITDGATYAQFEAHIDRERRRSELGLDFIGPPSFATDLVDSGFVPPGETVTMAADVAPGTWAIVCARKFEGVPDPLRVSDLVGPIEVDEQGVPRTEPQARSLMTTFLDARIAGSGAEQLVDCCQHFKEVKLNLYETSGGSPFVRYELTSLGTPLGDRHFRVTMYAEDGTRVIETPYRVGPRGDDMVVGCCYFTIREVT